MALVLMALSPAPLRGQGPATATPTLRVGRLTGALKLDGRLDESQWLSADSIDALTQVLAIELLTAARGIQLRAPLQPAPATRAVIDALGTEPGPDRFLAPEIAHATALVKSGAARPKGSPRRKTKGRSHSNGNGVRTLFPILLADENTAG